MQYTSQSFIRSFLWLGFFTTVLLSWFYLYFMSISMGLDLFGKSAEICPIEWSGP